MRSLYDECDGALRSDKGHDDARAQFVHGDSAFALPVQTIHGQHPDEARGQHEQRDGQDVADEHAAVEATFAQVSCIARGDTTFKMPAATTAMMPLVPSAFAMRYTMNGTNTSNST